MQARSRTGAALLAIAVIGLAAYLMLLRDPAAEPAVALPSGERVEKSEPSGLSQAVDGSSDVQRVIVSETEAGAADRPRAGTPVAEDAPPSRLVRARIVDERGAPLAGATLSLERGQTGLDAVSAADGAVALAVPLDRLRGSTTLRLRFAAEGRTTVERWIDLRPEGDCHVGDVALLPAGAVIGRVVDERGAPVVAGLSLCEVLPALSEHDRERLETLGEGLLHRGVWGLSDPDGSFRIESAPIGSCIVVASQTGFLFTPSEPLTILAGGFVDAGTLVLRAPGPEQSIEGVVLDAEGAPGSRQAVQLWRPGVARNVDPQVQSTASDEEGRFRFAVPRATTYHAVLLDRLGGEEVARIENVFPGGPPLVLHIPPQRRAELHVSTGDGVPIEEAYFGMFDAESHGMRSRPEKTGPGIWRLELPGRPFRLSAYARGYEGQSTEVLTPETAPERIEFVLQPERGARIRCLLTRAGEPVQGAQVIAYGLIEGPHRLNTGFSTRLESQPFGFSQATDEPGVHELRIRRTGTIALLVLVGGRVALEHGPLVVGPGGADREIDLALPEPGSIEGRVLLAEGREPAGLLVAASRGDGEVRAQTLDEDAHYLLEGLAPGYWQVRLLTDPNARRLLDDRRAYGAREEPRWDVALEAGQAASFDLDLRDETSCRLHGRVSLTPDGPSAWRFTLRGEWGQVGADGRFEHEAFGPGEAWLTLVASYGPTVRLSISERLDLTAGDNEWVLDVTSAELELTGVPAFDADTERRRGEPELLRLQWVGADLRRGVLRVQSHGGGPLLLRGLPPGAWTVETRYAPDGSPQGEWRQGVAEVTLAPGERATLGLGD